MSADIQVVLNTFCDPVVAWLESLSWIGTSTTFVDLPMVDEQIVPIAEALSMNMTLTKYTLSLFMVYPLAAILYAIPNKNAKHAFSFLVGLVMMQWIYGPDWIHSAITSLGTYLIAMVAPKKSQHIIAVMWVLGYMTGSHAYRMYVSYLSGVFDFTGTQMVLTMKLTSFAYNYYDGTADKKNVFPDTPHADKKKAKIYNDRKKFAIAYLPNPLEYFGYIFCFTCLLAGPAFEYNDYVGSIDGSIFHKNIEGDNKIPQKNNKPSTFLPAMQRLGVAVVCMVLHLQAIARFPPKSLYDAEFIANTPTVERYIFMLGAMLSVRFMFYFAWKVAEGASILGGFGFVGYDKDGNSLGFGGVENIDIAGFEMATNVQSMTRSWNKRTQGWLERYTYTRTNRSLTLTYFVSAIWHGLYPGFFFFFMSVPLMTNIERLTKAKINPLIVPEYDGYNISTYPNTMAGKIYWLLCWFFLKLVLDNIVQPFNFGSFERSHASLMSFNYFGHIVCIIVYVVLELMPSQKKAKTT